MASREDASSTEVERAAAPKAARREIEELPALLAALSPTLPPLTISVDGDQLRIVQPRLMTVGECVGAASFVGAIGALGGLVFAWLAGFSKLAGAGGGFAVLAGLMFMWMFLGSRAWTVVLDRSTRAVKRTGTRGLTATCGTSDVVALRPLAIDRSQVSSRLLVEPPDGAARELLFLVREGTDVTYARRLGAGIAAWLGVSFVEHPLAGGAAITTNLAADLLDLLA